MAEHALLQFDEAPRSLRQEDQDATERIAETLRSAGIDAPNSLYDEALALAREGHLGMAASRLQMLVCLDPVDADALLLLAKVHAAQGRPSEALTRLDAAVEAGGLPPAGLREHLESCIRTERVREEEHRARVTAREAGEIQSLRNETRGLRSEVIRLETEVADTRVRERNWKYAALGTSMLATVVIVTLALLRGPAGPAEEVVAAAPVEPVAEAAVPADAPTGSAPVVGQVTPPKAISAAPAKPVAVVDTPKPAAKAGKAGGKVHVVGSGDTLYKIADQYYGDSTRWEEIARANKRVLKKGNALSLGMELKIP